MHRPSESSRPAPPPYPPFAVDVRPDGDRTYVTPRGELDLVTVVPLEQAVLELCDDGVDHVSLDLRELTFFDSTALRMLLRLDDRFRAERRRFGIVVGDGFAARVLGMTRMLGRFRCEDGEVG